MFVKINNLVNSMGQADYKGLDISKNIPGSQAYALENGDNYCVLETTQETTPEHLDLIILTDEDYARERDEIISKMVPAPDPIAELRQENVELKQAIAELTMMIAAAPQA
ncbi:hypothetical protein MKZ15_15345 [Paenibacillus sp. FSL R7-0216]|uniref:hypothetical protein n=1 Tax=Paenibacillus sp. FSL R7-0216 TaxID=2921677 RepID=UPI0030DB39EE